MRSRCRANGDKEEGFRLWRLLLLVLLLAVAVALTTVYWSWIDAQARAVVVLSSVLKTPVLTPLFEGATGEPRFEVGLS